MHQKKYTSIVIGVGKIGSDLDQPHSKDILTHCHAFSQSNKFELLGVVDASYEKAKNVAKKWECTAFPTINEALSKKEIDVVSVCVPSSARKEVFEYLDEYRPKFIFLEKPIAQSFAELEYYENFFRSKNISCLINYVRNFDSTLVNIKKEIDENKWGKLQHGTVFYTKGFKNNGSHVLQYLAFLLGEIRSYQILGHICDYTEDDLSLEVRLTFKSGGKVMMIPVSEKNYSVVETTFYFEHARIHFRQFGLKYNISVVRPDPVFPGYQDLNEDSVWENTSLLQSFPNALNTIADILDTGTTNKKMFYDVLNVEKVLHKIYESRNEPNKEHEVTI